MSELRNPNPREVQLVYKDTYIFFTKWFNVAEPNWDEIISESHDLEAKYPFELTVKILVELVGIIEKYYMERNENNG